MASISAALLCRRLGDSVAAVTTTTTIAALCFVAGFVAASSVSAAEPTAAPRLDVYGDPLPPGVLARFGSMRFCADSGGRVTWAEYTPDGKLLVTAGSGIVEIWQADTGKLDGEIRLPPSASQAHSISPDSKLLAVASDGKVRFYDLATRQSKYEFKAQSRVPATLAGWSRDSRRIVIGSETACQVREVADGRVAESIAGDWPRSYCAATGLIATLAKRSHPNEPMVLRLIRASDGGLIREIKLGYQDSMPLAFSPDGKQLVVREKATNNVFDHDDVSLCMLDVATGAEIRRLKADVSSAFFSPDGTMLSVGASDNAWVLRVADGKTLHEGVYGHCFSPDGKTLVVGSPRVVLVDTNTWRAREPLPAGRKIAVIGGGNRIATSSALDDEVLIRDCNGGRLLERVPAPHSQSLACLPDGHTLVVGTPGRVVVWDADRRRLVRQFPVDQPASAFEGVVVSADGTTLAVSDETAVSAYSVGSGERLARIETGGNGSLVLSRDGKLLAGLVAAPKITGDAITVIWDITQRREVLRIVKPVREFELPLAFTRGGHMLFASSNHTDDTQDFTEFSIYEIATGKPVQVVRSEDAWGLVAATSADCRSIAVASGEVWRRGIKYLDFATGLVSAPVESRPAFSIDKLFPDGRRYAASTAGGSLFLADLPKPLPSGVEGLPPVADHDLPRLWEELKGSPAGAYRASIALATGGARTVQFLQGRWTPPVLDVDRVQAAIKRLSDDNVDTRSKARDTLALVGPIAVPLLR